MNNLRCTVIIPAAGQGKRMNSSISKQYIALNDKPILVHTLECFEKCPDISNIILVVGKGEIPHCQKEIIEKYSFKKIINIIEGGKERQNSVYEGIKIVPEETDIVLIHDAARPLVSTNDIKKTIICAIEYEACVLGVKVKDTIKVVDNNKNIIDTPNRIALWSIQTPQVFKKELISLVHHLAAKDKYIGTDDSMLVEKYSNKKVRIVEGSYSNIKITTREDLIFAKNFIKDISV
jgi:2-C-methyl-D-erythritol 4-phosphate cytidylyltransferase